MSKLGVRTRGDSPYQGKSRVYFSCHQEDFLSYFDILCSEIFETQNCAIYYKTEWIDNIEDDLVIMLKDMQVFVIPITTKFLFADRCCARDFEYGFAIENHIPIIPIAMENGLYKRFSSTMNEIGKGYGDINYINRASFELSRIPYKEKLRMKLDSIIIGDELGKRIRAAFDAYIFMSYRKKDREYARQLMELIHRIPYCRDIAIWYDEYLVSGEKWKPAIADAMKKSQLITLAVTPNLMEPGNYIAKHEYPDAIKFGKKVIPIMMLPTEHKELVKLYEGIDKLVNGRNEKELECVLQAIAIQKSKDTPEHNYLIGLAYLNGIDVEQNTQYAIDMISFAADQKLPEAIKKMVDMHMNGEGVEINYLQAISWQEKYIKLCENLKRNIDVVIELWKLGDMCKMLGDDEKAIEVYHRMLEYAKIVENERHTSETIRYIGISYTNIGKIYLNSGQYIKAKGMFQKAKSIDEYLVKEVGTEYEFLDLAVCYHDLGDVCVEMEENDMAREYYKKMLEYIKKLAEKSPQEKIRRALSIGKYKLAKINWKLGEKSEAIDCFKDALRKVEQLSEETKRIEDRHLLCAYYNEYGVMMASDGDYSEASHYLGLGMKLSKELLKQYNMRIDFCSTYACICINLGYLNLERGNKSEAIKLFKKGIEIDEKLAKKASRMIILDSLTKAFRWLGEIHEENYDIEDAKKNYRKAIDIEAKMNDVMDFSEKRQSDLSIDYGMLANLVLAEHEIITIAQFDEIDELYHKSMEISRKLFCERHIISEGINYHANLIKLGDINKSYSEMLLKHHYFYDDNKNITIVHPDEKESKERYEESANYYLRSVEMLKEIVEIDNSLIFRRCLITSYNRCGNIYERDEPEKAKKYALRAIELSIQMVEETEELSDYRILYICYYRCGEICNSVDEGCEEALNYHTKALNIAKYIYEKNESAETYCELAECYRRIGDLYKIRKNVQNALEFFFKELEIRKEMYEDNLLAKTKNNLVNCYEKIGAMYLAENKIEEGKKYIKKMLEIEYPDKKFCLDYL